MFRLPEFFIGVCAAVIFLRERTPARLVWLLIPAAGLIPVMGFLGRYNTSYMGLNAMTLPLVACLIVGFAAAENARFSRLILNRVTKHLGEISYSFFVFQMPIMLWLDANPKALSGWTLPAAFFLLLALNVVAADVSYRLIERPGRRILLGVLQRRASTSVARRAVAQ